VRGDYATTLSGAVNEPHGQRKGHELELSFTIAYGPSAAAARTTGGSREETG